MNRIFANRRELTLRASAKVATARYKRENETKPAVVPTTPAPKTIRLK